ncbi:hypothetical protein JAAARDRAFT_110450, partial [Jaapia argillacea MUCL 33604]
LNDTNYAEWCVLMEALLVRKGLWDVLPHVRSAVVTEVWETLKAVHRARGFATRLALRRRFLTAAKKDSQSMVSWIADVRRNAFKLEDIGVKVEDKDLILVLTMGLPPAYETFVVSLDSTPPDDLILEFVIARLLNEEARQ